MAMVLAEEHEWSVDKNDLKFVVKNDFVGLCNGTHQRNHFVIVFFECIRQWGCTDQREIYKSTGIKDGSIDAFMWEKFMTKPYVDKGELVQVDFILLIGLFSWTKPTTTTLHNSHITWQCNNRLERLSLRGRVSWLPQERNCWIVIGMWFNDYWKLFKSVVHNSNWVVCLNFVSFILERSVSKPEKCSCRTWKIHSICFSKVRSARWWCTSMVRECKICTIHIHFKKSFG